MHAHTEQFANMNHKQWATSLFDLT